MILKQFAVGPMQNFCYLIGDEKTKKAMIVDPAWAPDKIMTLVESEGFTLSGLLITHAHYDHTNAIESLLEKYDVPVYAHKKEIEYSKSGVTIVGDLGRTARATADGDKIELGDTVIRIIHTPGHTPGSQCLQVDNALITGDTLFVGGCGRSDLPGGDAATLFQSLQKIAKLSPQTEICPGHDYGEAPQRRLQQELQMNPYLRMTSPDQFVSAVSQ